MVAPKRAGDDLRARLRKGLVAETQRCAQSVEQRLDPGSNLIGPNSASNPAMSTVSMRPPQRSPASKTVTVKWPDRASFEAAYRPAMPPPTMRRATDGSGTFPSCHFLAP